MKKLYFSFIAIFITSLSLAQGLGVGIGPSFWTVNDIMLKDNQLKLIDNNKKAGFNLNARVKLGSGSLRYVFNAGWNRFSIDQVKITDPTTPSTTYDLTLSQNIFPISGGLELGIPAADTRIYACGDVAYNIIKNSIDYNRSFDQFTVGVPIIFGNETTYRIGASVGLGFEFKLVFLMLDINARLHFPNFFNKETNETTTSFLMTNITIFFGS